MFSYIAKDLKRAAASKGARLYLIGTAVLVLIANIAVIAFRFIYGSNEGTFSYNVFEYASWCFLIPYYSCILLGMMAFGTGYPDAKKEGLKPWQMYIAKLIEAIVLAVIFLVIAFVLLYVVTQLFHINEGAILWGVIKSFLAKAALSISLWFAGISFAIMFLFLIRNRLAAFLGFAVVTVIIPQLIRIFSLDSFKFEFFRIIRRYTITQSFGLVPYPSYPDRSVPLIVTLGIVYGLLALAVGITVYSKKAAKDL